MSPSFSLCQLSLPDQPDQIDDQVARAGAPLTQSLKYAHWNRAVGRKVFRLMWQNEKKEPRAFAQALIYNLKLNQKVLYLPHGPVLLKDRNPELVKTVIKDLSSLSQEHSAFLLRCDPLPPTGNDPVWTELGSRTPEVIKKMYFSQPAREWAIDLTGSINDIWQKLPGSTRHDIRKNKTPGIATEIIDHGTVKYFEIFYQLMNITAQRNKFTLHSREYYSRILEQITKHDDDFMVLIRYNGQPVAVNLIIGYGQTALYLFGGSKRIPGNLNPSYWAQWVSLTEAKARNFKWYNQGGISTESEPRPSWEGLTKFKKKFPGQTIKYSPSYDFPIQKTKYYSFLTLKKITDYGKKLR